MISASRTHPMMTPLSSGSSGSNTPCSCAHSSAAVRCVALPAWIRSRPRSSVAQLRFSTSLRARRRRIADAHGCLTVSTGSPSRVAGNEKAGSRAKTLALRDRPCELASPARSRTAMPASPSASLAELRRGERSAARASVRVCLPEVGRDLRVRCRRSAAAR